MDGPRFSCSGICGSALLLYGEVSLCLSYRASGVYLVYWPKSGVVVKIPADGRHAIAVTMYLTSALCFSLFLLLVIIALLPIRKTEPVRVALFLLSIFSISLAVAFRLFIGVFLF